MDSELPGARKSTPSLAFGRDLKAGRGCKNFRVKKKAGGGKGKGKSWLAWGSWRQTDEKQGLLWDWLREHFWLSLASLEFGVEQGAEDSEAGSCPPRPDCPELIAAVQFGFPAHFLPRLWGRVLIVADILTTVHLYSQFLRSKQQERVIS